MSEYKTLIKKSEFHMTEKRSEFIGYAFPCASIDEVNERIDEIRHKHSDATHNVFAYILRDNNTARFNDDGEPHGTAGVPVLEVIRKEGLIDTLIIVTRYFGGTLLGAGGLVRAYSAAAKGAIDLAGSCTLVPYVDIIAKCEYQDYGKVEYEMGKMEIEIINTEFTDKVSITLHFPEENLNNVEKKLNEILCNSKKYHPESITMGPKKQTQASR